MEGGWCAGGLGVGGLGWTGTGVEQASGGGGWDGGDLT